MKTDNESPLKSLPESDDADTSSLGLSLLDRTFASSYPTADEIDPDEEAFALGKAVEILLRVKDKEGDEGRLGGRVLIDRIKEEGSILSLKDVARVLHRAWRGNLIHRAIDRPHLRDTRHSFVYWVDETNAALEDVLASLSYERTPASNETSKENSAMNPTAANLPSVETTPFVSTFVAWISLDGRKTPMQGMTLANIPAGTSAYAHLHGASRKSYARNFKDVASVDRVLVFDERTGRYYAPAVHVLARTAEISQVVEPLESKKEREEIEDLVATEPSEAPSALVVAPSALVVTPSALVVTPSALALPPEIVELPIPVSEPEPAEVASVEASEAFAPLKLEDSFMRSYEAALIWRMKTGLSWSAGFMIDLIEQAAREARQVAREREHHRAVRRVVLAQTDLLRAAILLDEGAETPIGEGADSSLATGVA